MTESEAFEQLRRNPTMEGPGAARWSSSWEPSHGSLTGRPIGYVPKQAQAVAEVRRAEADARRAEAIARVGCAAEANRP